MQILHTENNGKGKFYIEVNGIQHAYMSYTRSGTNRIIIDHTEVDDILRGQNAGKQLVAKAVEFAREKGIKILPLCPFAKSLFAKMKDWEDVL